MKVSWANKKKMSLVYRVVNFLAWGMLRLFYRVKIYGLEHYFEGPAVIAANHASYLDPPLIGTSWPEDIHYLAREGLFKNRLFGSFISKLNSHPLKGGAGDVGVFKTVLKLLTQGKKVILFPEGKRTFNGEFSSIKPGLGLLVMKSNSSIIPTYVFGTFKAWPRTKKWPKVWSTLGCVFGSPISAKDFENLDRKAAQEMMTQKYVEALKGLKKWYEDGAQGSPP